MASSKGYQTESHRGRNTNRLILISLVFEFAIKIPCGDDVKQKSKHTHRKILGISVVEQKRVLGL